MKSIWKRNFAGLSIRDPQTGTICWVFVASDLTAAIRPTEAPWTRRHTTACARAKLRDVLSVRRVESVVRERGGERGGEGR
jgi:hypothetical protein